MTPNHLSSTLQSHHNWLITTHKGPDGDAVGSVIAWAAYAQQCGKDYQIIFPDQPAAYLCPFLESYHWEVFSLEKKYAGDLLFALDYNTASRVGEEMSAWFENQTLTKVMIDHHLAGRSIAEDVGHRAQLLPGAGIEHHHHIGRCGREPLGGGLAT